MESLLRYRVVVVRLTAPLESESPDCLNKREVRESTLLCYAPRRAVMMTPLIAVTPGVGD